MSFTASFTLEDASGGRIVPDNTFTDGDSATGDACRSGDEPTVVWPQPEAAAGYRLVVIPEVGAGRLLREFTADTCFRLPPGTQEVRVEAFDANAFRYLAEDPQVISAGIDGAPGLFGSLVRAGLRLDE